MAKRQPLYPHIPKGSSPVSPYSKERWVEETLPFASSTGTKVWWLATMQGSDGRDKVHQVEVSGLDFRSIGIEIKDWQIDQLFANTVAKISVPRD